MCYIESKTFRVLKLFSYSNSLCILETQATDCSSSSSACFNNLNGKTMCYKGECICKLCYIFIQKCTYFIKWLESFFCLSNLRDLLFSIQNRQYYSQYSWLTCICIHFQGNPTQNLDLICRQHPVQEWLPIGL